MPSNAVDVKGATAVSRFFVPLGAAVWLALFAIRVVAGAGGQAPTPQTPAAPQPPPATAPGVQAPASGYVGTETCVTCHDQSVHGTPHGRAADARTPMAQSGCESCHGPGKAHVDAGGAPQLIRRFKAMKPQDASAACTTCHTRGDHAFWDGSQHNSRNLSCVTCHSVHAPKSEKRTTGQGHGNGRVCAVPPRQGREGGSLGTHAGT